MHVMWLCLIHQTFDLCPNAATKYSQPSNINRTATDVIPRFLTRSCSSKAPTVMYTYTPHSVYIQLRLYTLYILYIPYTCMDNIRLPIMVYYLHVSTAFLLADSSQIAQTGSKPLLAPPVSLFRPSKSCAGPYRCAVILKRFVQLTHSYQE